jgi:hypothetical protein
MGDVNAIVSAMQLFFHDNSRYPTPDIASPAGPDALDGSPAWNTFMISWPSAPIPPDNPSGSSACDGAVVGTGTNQYTYTQLSSGADYNVTFCLGSQVGDYGPGIHTLSSTGIL